MNLGTKEYAEESTPHPRALDNWHSDVRTTVHPVPLLIADQFVPSHNRVTFLSTYVFSLSFQVIGGLLSVAMRFIVLGLTRTRTSESSILRKACSSPVLH